MTLPVVAIVGRPNVGKSTLFNRLTKTRDAVISAFPGTTRDRQYGEAKSYHEKFIVIDTGGLSDESDPMSHLISKQVSLAIEEANSIIFLLDGRAGITADDKELARWLRQTGKPITVALNKAEGLDQELISSDAYEL